ncbi:hypothetical protein [Hydrocarboniclastica marina]|uniref:Uncharacterized protein n=1 Tax=Hydrocarboniclastica marina TaxID=2259620 RepID=A0A4V1D9B5_9ALTE|nr:hypothetical protein [Hydrocarboniclastica marina]QCF28110.1 hypothetical protein soil367_18740 [Hydrocarboniclastica marina]
MNVPSSPISIELWAYPNNEYAGGYAPVAGLCLVATELSQDDDQIEWAKKTLLNDHSPCLVLIRQSPIEHETHNDRLIRFQEGVNRKATVGDQLYLF